MSYSVHDVSETLAIYRTLYYCPYWKIVKHHYRSTKFRTVGILKEGLNTNYYLVSRLALAKAMLTPINFSCLEYF